MSCYNEIMYGDNEGNKMSKKKMSLRKAFIEENNRTFHENIKEHLILRKVKQPYNIIMFDHFMDCDFLAE
jgi:hypothetical protein